MINHKITIKQIGELFANNGYILSDCGIMQYNNYLSAFEDVSDNEVLDIFRRVYPNFERRVLKVDMLKEYLPKITDTDFAKYDFVNKGINYNLNETKLNQEIQKIVEYNNNRKKNLPGVIPGNDYDKCIQFLINNDIYTDCNILFKYTNNDFEPISHLSIKKLFQDTIVDNMDMDKYLRIVYIGLNELTYITDIKEDLDAKHLLNSINNDYWDTYNRINEIINRSKQQ